MSKPPKHILVIRLSAMGDVAMSVPVIRALCTQNPDLKITFLTKPFFKPFFRDIKNVNVFDADVNGKYKGILGLYKLSRELKQKNIDAVADLHNVLRSKILKLFFSGIPFFQIDKGRKEKKKLISGKIFKQLKTTHERYTDVFKKLDLNIDLSHPKFPQKIILNDQLRPYISEGRKNIGVAPFAAFKSKSYPLELMEKVIQQLSKEYNVLLFGGGKEEVSQLSKLEEKYDNTTNLAGKLTLDQELDIVSNLTIMLSMDSGNAHIAAMLGVNTITLWGVTHPYSGFYPFNQNTKNAIITDRVTFPKIPTSVYGNKYPKNYEKAIASITPEQIIEKIKEVEKNSLT